MKNKYLNIVGMMSGTSLDGIDLSFIKTDGNNVIRSNKNYYYKYSKTVVDLLYSGLKLNEKIFENPEFLKKLNNIITSEHAKAYNLFNIENDVDLIGFHGQTIYHDAKKQISFQLGDGKKLSKLLNKSVMFDFRSNDINNSGQGAPLAPIYHKQIIEEIKLDSPSCFINIGGISNITYWDGINLIGFDSGPGNCLIDSYVRKKFNLEFDFNGQKASMGNPNKKILNLLLTDKYFFLSPPKSLDRVYFNKYLLDYFDDLSPHDALSTLCHFTILSIIDCFKYLPSRPKNIIVSGGGLKNKYLMNIFSQVSNCQIIKLKNYDLYPDFIESELIAFIAARGYYNKPITFPSTTGVKKPCSGGKLIINNLN